MVGRAVRVQLGIGEVKQVFNNMVDFVVKMLIKLLEHYIKAIEADIEESELAAEVEQTIKDIEAMEQTIKVMEQAIEARTAVMDIGVSTVANMVFDRVKMPVDCTDFIVAIRKHFVAH